MLSTLSYIAVSPLLLVQALHTRARALRLPEPEGPRSGTLGKGPQLRLLIVGDSAAAGVGVAHQQDALSGRLMALLAERFRVSWALEAESGARTSCALDRLFRLDPQTFDVAVTSLGVNDVTGHTGRRKWIRLQRELRGVLKERFGVSFTIVSGLPPVHGFPALPQPLRHYLGSRATRFDEQLKADLEGCESAIHLDLRFSENPELIARDGFHPGAEIYAEWARRAALEITGRCG